MTENRFIENLSTEVDFRGVAAGDRTTTLLQAYERLGPEEGFILVDERDPALYLNLLQTMHPGDFDWIPLTIQPGRWRVGLARRSVALEGSQRVVRFMTEEHLRLSLLLRHVCDLVEQKNLAEAARASGFLATILARHIHGEEEILFTLFPQPPPHLPEWHMDDLYQEHRGVIQYARRLNEVLKDATGQTDIGPGMEQEVSRLARRLDHEFSDHAAKEERLLYTWVDMLLGQDEIDCLVQKLQAIKASFPPL